MRHLFYYAWRDMQQGTSRLRVLLLCLVLGVGLMASLGSLTAAMNAALEEDASTLLGGDILITLTHRPASAEEYALLAAQGDVMTLINARSMAMSAKGARRLVEIKAVEAAYPLFGDWRVTPESAKAAIQDAVAEPFPMLVVPAFLDSLRVALGDTVTIAGVAFRVTGLIENEPDAVSSGISFGARVMMSHQALAATGMLERGGFVRYQYGIRLPEGASLLTVLSAIQQGAPDAGWTVEDRRDASPSTRQFIDRIGTYLLLVALATLAIGGLGMGSAAFAYMQYKKPTIAVLKATGARRRDIVWLYAIQLTGIASIGMALGVLLGTAMPYIIAHSVGQWLPVPLKLAVYPLPLALAAWTGFCVMLLAVAVPLMAATQIPASSLFRQMDDSLPLQPSFGNRLVLVLLLALLASSFFLVAGNPRLVMMFGAGMLVAAALLLLGGDALRWVLTRLRSDYSVTWRFAARSLHQQPARTRLIILSYGLGFAVLATVAALDSNFQTQLLSEIPKRAPTFFIIDIDPEDRDAVIQKILALDPKAEIESAPILRGRFIGAAGRPIDPATVPEEIAWVFNSDRGLSFRNTPPTDGSLVEGAWWPADYQGESLVSIDARIARGLGLAIGDSVTVNVLGRPVTARIANMRAINWSTLSINFTFIFDEATLAKAPYTYLATTTVKPAVEGAIIEALARDYPHMTAIDVQSALSTVQRVMEAISAAARVATLFTIITGLLVFAGIGTANALRHVYDSTILKMVGATRGQILRILLVEYGIMGSVAGLLALLAGTGIAYLFVGSLLNLPWQWPWATLLLIMLASIVMALAVGGMVLYRVLRVPPAAILRHES